MAVAVALALGAMLVAVMCLFLHFNLIPHTLEGMIAAWNVFLVSGLIATISNNTIANPKRTSAGTRVLDLIWTVAGVWFAIAVVIPWAAPTVAGWLL